MNKKPALDPGGFYRGDRGRALRGVGAGGGAGRRRRGLQPLGPGEPPARAAGKLRDLGGLPARAHARRDLQVLHHGAQRVLRGEGRPGGQVVPSLNPGDDRNRDSAPARHAGAPGNGFAGSR